MDADPWFAAKYDEQMRRFIDNKYLVPLDESDKRLPDDKVWYLPHFRASNANKPDKFRIVFDAASRVDGVSLNDRLQKGPDLLVNLTSLLLQFRRFLYAFAGDVKDMFCRVAVREQDQNYQRVLYRGMDRKNPPHELKMRVLIFGATCSPALAGSVKNINAKQQNVAEDIRDAIINKHYVDDYLDCCDDLQESITRIKGVIACHKEAGFEIRNFVSNSNAIIKSLPEESRAQGLQVNLDMVGNQEKVLGIWWDVATDNLTFKINPLKLPESVATLAKLPTRRQALSVLMSVYDPLGMATPFTVKGKIMMQNLCPPEKGESWDDSIPEEQRFAWMYWIKQFSLLRQIQIPRCYSGIEFRNASCELHVFSDGSKEAWGAVAYLRFVLPGKIHVSFAMSKTKVVPKKGKNYTIPRIELEGAVLGTKIASQIKSNIGIQIHKQIHWTDSTTVVQWVNKEPSQFKQFVAARVQQIQATIDPKCVRWVPGTQNPADDITRAAGKCEFRPGNRFHNASGFLWNHDETTWPVRPETGGDTQDWAGILMLSIKDKSEIPTDRLIKRGIFSQWNRLVNSVGYILKFIEQKTDGRFPSKEQDAIDVLIRLSQERSFSPELKALRSGRDLEKNSKLRKFTPFIDDKGLLRHDGRFNNLPGATEDFKRPIILDSSDWMVEMMLRWYHFDLKHNGVLFIAAEVRQKYLITNAKRALWKIKDRCVFCQIRSIKPRPPIMGQLPAERLESYIHPFSYTGIDFFGPMEIKIGRSRVKRYGAIFTCFSTRAVHLELCDSLSADSCIMAIRRFIGRRGTPKKIFSDNGSNLRGANNEMNVDISERTRKYFVYFAKARKIGWHFNTPLAPFMGGVWERLVRTVKIALKKALSATVPTEELLRTVLVEAEHTVNSRPLCLVTDDDVMLTPNHLILRRSSGLLPPGRFDKRDLLLKKQWRASQYLADVFWKAWVKYYLPKLSQRPKWWDEGRQLQVDDLVVIADNKEERNSWPRGRIVKIYPDSKGIVRIVDVKTQQGIYRRPAAKIGVLSLE